MALPEAPKEGTGAKLLGLVSGLIGSLGALGSGITFGVLELRGDANFWTLVLIAMLFALGCFGLYYTVDETREWLSGGGPARPATSRMSTDEQSPNPLSEACLAAAAEDGLGAPIAWYRYFDNDRRLLAVLAVPAGLLGMLMTVMYFAGGKAGLGSGAGVFTAAMAASYIYLRNAAPRFPHRGWAVFTDGLVVVNAIGTVEHVVRWSDVAELRSIGIPPRDDEVGAPYQLALHTRGGKTVQLKAQYVAGMADLRRQVYAAVANANPNCIGLPR